MSERLGDPADVDSFNTPANKPRRDGNIETDELLAFMRKRGGACVNYFQSQKLLKYIDQLEERIRELEEKCG